MSGPAESEAPEYRAARLHRALAEDPRTSELGVQVSVDGDDIRLTGTVSSESCKEELGQVLHEWEPGATVHNDVRVVEADEPGEAEVIR
ncbi:BON domain-containing protein [Prauserella shujinwangii]|uniref:BON domain-containing protein n=1 Tax=Prauserella shujinwangii TaxID=1453103 RepID=A0A2T0LR21_9PSEU|nr:BON domain-containing protein [Prauserella shujinwangii]PRX45951.1 BON domain-containing protein [Prauserella shujinwangii]